MSLLAKRDALRAALAQLLSQRVGPPGGAVRKAVCVGIDYTGTPFALAGCSNDALRWRQRLCASYRFAPGDVRLLLEEATADTFWSATDWLLSGAQPGDTLVLTFAGHGTQLPDKNWPPDEPDGLDEELVPRDVDFAGNNALLDDNLHSRIFSRVPDGVNLIAITSSRRAAAAAAVLPRAARVVTGKQRLLLLAPVAHRAVSPNTPPLPPAAVEAVRQVPNALSRCRAHEPAISCDTAPRRPTACAPTQPCDARARRLGRSPRARERLAARVGRPQAPAASRHSGRSAGL